MVWPGSPGRNRRLVADREQAHPLLHDPQYGRLHESYYHSIKVGGWMKKIALSLLLIPALGHSQAIKQGGVSAANLLISSLTATGVGAPGTAGSATIIPVFNFNSQGQITAISSATAAPAAGSIAAGTLAGGVLLPSGNLTGVV